MLGGEFGAAWFFYRSKFHEFGAGMFGVVEVELPFAVAADFGFFGGLRTDGYEFLFDGVNVGDAEGNVVHDAKGAFVCSGRNIEHVLDPVGAVGNLHGDPAVLVVLHAAVPVGTEAEKIHVEPFGDGAVVDDETRVNDPNRAGGI